MDDGILLVAHLDVELGEDAAFQAFRRDPEWLYGEAIGLSRAPLAMLEYSLRALRNQKRLRHQRLGVLVYADEGAACRFSKSLIRAAAKRVSKVLVLRPGSPSGRMVTQRRGLRTYQLVAEGKPGGLGKTLKRPDVLRWVCNKVEGMATLASPRERLEVYAAGMETAGFPNLLPHRVRARILVSYGESHVADETEARIRKLLGKGPITWQLHKTTDRPPMPDRRRNYPLVEELREVAAAWEIPLETETSASPSVAGLVPEETAVVCGLAPLARDLNTPHEAVQRTRLVQSTLLLTQFLVRNLERKGRRKS
jgi:acetylornithine deacetylase/succinyl-diaminopimelate desuccinylase-like protein